MYEKSARINCLEAIIVDNIEELQDQYTAGYLTDIDCVHWQKVILDYMAEYSELCYTMYCVEHYCTPDVYRRFTCPVPGGGAVECAACSTPCPRELSLMEDRVATLPLYYDSITHIDNSALTNGDFPWNSSMSLDFDELWDFWSKLRDFVIIYILPEVKSYEPKAV